MTRPSEAKRRAAVEPSLFEQMVADMYQPEVPVEPQTRHDDPTTSAKAAAKAAITAKSRAYRLLCVYEYAETWDGGTFPSLTSDEAAVIAREPIYEARKRISDLIRLGLIEDTGEEGQSIQGNDARLLKITDDGLRALHVARGE